MNGLRSSALVFWLVVSGSAQTRSVSIGTAAVPLVRANDNRVAAGRFSKDTLRLRLVVQMADWYAESDTGPVLRVAAFAEEGRAPQVPAPLIRVREGTIVVASVRNDLPDSTITILGLNTHPSVRDSMFLPPGESRQLTFPAGAPGTYYYRARIGRTGPGVERDQTGGAFVVDPVGGSPPDRVLVLNVWATPIDSVTLSNALAINGRSWPYTERMETVVGDTVHWRVVNATGREHPMHLHGAYFRVDSKGGIFRDSIYAPDQRRLAVTEEMLPRQTMNIAWSPVRPGRWLLHCHLVFHVTPTSARIVPAAHGGHDEMATDPEQHMAGLVIGIDARMPAGKKEAARLRPTRLDLFAQEGARRGASPRSQSFVLQRGPSAPAPDSTELPSSVLFLTRGQPTDVTVHNRIGEPVSIHWHGLELESFSDGVAGWGSTAGRVAPHVEPGGTFTAHLDSPRAGTFIYHTHLRDASQLTAGMYGAIIVVEPGQVFDPRTDHLQIVGWDGYEADSRILVNGDADSSSAVVMRVGETHRFRFVNIGAAAAWEFSITRDSIPAQWRPVAKDGAELPSSQRVPRAARIALDVGETYDFEFTAPAIGEYVLSMPLGPPGKAWTRRLVVR